MVEAGGDFYDVAENFAEGYTVGSGQTHAVKPAVLAQISALDGLQRAANQVIEWRVEDARTSSTSWSKIGDALDTSKQAVQQRFGKHDTPVK